MAGFGSERKHSAFQFVLRFSRHRAIADAKHVAGLGLSLDRESVSIGLTRQSLDLLCDRHAGDGQVWHIGRVQVQMLGDQASVEEIVLPHKFEKLLIGQQLRGPPPLIRSITRTAMQKIASNGWIEPVMPNMCIMRSSPVSKPLEKLQSHVAQHHRLTRKGGHGAGPLSN